MQCLFFIWRPGHHRSSEELQWLGKGVMGDSKFKNSNVHGSHSNKDHQAIFLKLFALYLQESLQLFFVSFLSQVSIFKRQSRQVIY